MLSNIDVHQWLIDIYKCILEYGKKPYNLYVAIRFVEKLDGGYLDIRIKPISMGKEYGRYLTYSPFARDTQDKRVIVLRVEDFISILKESESDELQIPIDRFRERDISARV